MNWHLLFTKLRKLYRIYSKLIIHVKIIFYFRDLRVPKIAILAVAEVVLPLKIMTV